MLTQLRHSNSFTKPSIILCVLLLCACLSFSASPQEQPSNPVSSIAELRTRAESGDALARHHLSNFLSQRDSHTPGYDIALDWLRRLAVRNQPDALYLLGFLYEHGHGLRRNYVKAAENYQAAALLGNHFAQNNLASLYQHGHGVPKNIWKATELYLASARHGNPIAQCNLASLYFTGSDVPRDLSEAARWFRAAAEQSYPPLNTTSRYFISRVSACQSTTLKHWLGSVWQRTKVIPRPKQASPTFTKPVKACLSIMWPRLLGTPARALTANAPLLNAANLFLAA